MENKNRPLVIVTGPSKKLRFGWWATRLQLWRVGLKAKYIHPRQPELPKKFDGVIIGGGDDIDPQHYGRTGSAGANYDVARDALEIDVLKQALADNMPVLGICRGAQLLNIVMGGNLHQDLRPKRKLTPNRNSLFPIKTARLVQPSRLSSILKAKQAEVNSLHSQAVDQVGDSLTPVAHDDDGFIQAIEDPDQPFLVGVQWHPEYLIFSRLHLRLFRALAVAVNDANSRG